MIQKEASSRWDRSELEGGLLLVSSVVDGPEGDGLVVLAHPGPASGDGVVVVPLVHNLVSLP